MNEDCNIAICPFCMVNPCILAEREDDHGRHLHCCIVNRIRLTRPFRRCRPCVPFSSLGQGKYPTPPLKSRHRAKNRRKTPRNLPLFCGKHLRKTWRKEAAFQKAAVCPCWGGFSQQKRDPNKAQRSGFVGKRRNSGESELCPLAAKRGIRSLFRRGASRASGCPPTAPSAPKGGTGQKPGPTLRA